MAGIGTKILASDYNAIQALAQNVLGAGSGQFGYGQTVTSTQVASGNPFRLLDWLNLRSDLLKIGAHQTGNVNEGDELIIPGNLDPVNITGFMSKTGSGPFLVRFSFAAIASAPAIGAPYKIQGCTVNEFNGVFKCVASTIFSITLSYPTDPGVFPSSTQGAGDNPFDQIGSVKVSSVLTDEIRGQYLDYAQEKYLNASAPTQIITGTTNSSTTLTSTSAAIIMVGALVDGPGLLSGTRVTAVQPGQRLTLNQATSSSTTDQFVITFLTDENTTPVTQKCIKTVAASQLTPNEVLPGGVIVRNQAWNGTVQTTATYTFISPNAARAFFNSGSQLEISQTLTGSFGSGSALKDNTWKDMFSAIGIIAIRANDTIQIKDGFPDVGTTPSEHYPIGWFDLTDTDRLIFKKQAPDGFYAANVLNVYARRPLGGITIIVTIRYEDNATVNNTPGTNVPNPNSIDEIVSGILTVTLSTTRASGANVSVPAPSLSVTPIA